MRPTFLEQLQASLAGQRPRGVVAAYLFGSHAEGRAHTESDVDIGVLFDFVTLPSRMARFDHALTLSADLQSIIGQARLDLVVLNDAPPGLSARIAAGGQLLYVSDREAEHAFRRDAQLRAADVAPFIAKYQGSALLARDKGD